MSLQCMKKERCDWPDCQCSDAVKRGRWRGHETQCHKCGGGTGQAKPCTCAVEAQAARMYADSQHERADPAKMQAELERHFGPALGLGCCDAKGWSQTQNFGKMPARVIPIQSIDVANEEPAKFDHEILQMMMFEAGALCGRTPDEPYIAISFEQLKKLAEALNNL